MIRDTVQGPGMDRPRNTEYDCDMTSARDRTVRDTPPGTVREWNVARCGTVSTGRRASAMFPQLRLRGAAQAVEAVEAVDNTALALSCMSRIPPSVSHPTPNAPARVMTQRGIHQLVATPTPKPTPPRCNITASRGKPLSCVQGQSSRHSAWHK